MASCFSYSKTRTPTTHLQQLLLPIMTSSESDLQATTGALSGTYCLCTGFTTSHPKEQSPVYQKQQVVSYIYWQIQHFRDNTLQASVGSWDISQYDFICQMYGLARESEKWDHLHLLTSQNPRSECLRRLWGLTYNFYGSVGTRYYTYSITLASGL